MLASPRSRSKEQRGHSEASAAANRKGRRTKRKMLESRSGLLSGSRPRRISQNQFSGYVVFPALGVGGARKFMQGVGRHLPQHVPVNVHGGERRVAIFSQASVVKPRHRNIFRHAAASLQ